MKNILKIVILLTCICGVFISQHISYADTFLELPSYTKGDTWTVSAENSNGSTAQYKYEVTDITDIRNESYYVIRVTSDKVKNSYLDMYVRAKDFYLQKVVESSPENPASENISQYDIAVFSQKFLIPAHCDFPKFDTKLTGERTTVKEDIMTQKIKKSPGQKYTIELSKPYEGGTLESIQTWEKGKKWWSTVKEYRTANGSKTLETTYTLNDSSVKSVPVTTISKRNELPQEPAAKEVSKETTQKQTKEESEEKAETQKESEIIQQKIAEQNKNSTTTNTETYKTSFIDNSDKSIFLGENASDTESPAEEPEEIISSESENAASISDEASEAASTTDEGLEQTKK